MLVSTRALLVPSLLAALALLALAPLSVVPVLAVPCAAPPPLDPAQPVRIAILAYCNATVGVLPANPNSPASGCSPDRTARGLMIAAYWDGQTNNKHAGKGHARAV